MEPTGGADGGPVPPRQPATGRPPSDPCVLSLDELRVAFKGYNWWGKHDLSFEAARRALVLDPTNLELHYELEVAIRNCSVSADRNDSDASHDVLSMYDRMIEEGVISSEDMQVFDFAGSAREAWDKIVAARRGTLHQHGDLQASQRPLPSPDKCRQIR